MIDGEGRRFPLACPTGLRMNVHWNPIQKCKERVVLILPEYYLYHQRSGSVFRPEPSLSTEFWVSTNSMWCHYYPSILSPKAGTCIWTRLRLQHRFTFTNETVSHKIVGDVWSDQTGWECSMWAIRLIRFVIRNFPDQNSFGGIRRNFRGGVLSWVPTTKWSLEEFESTYRSLKSTYEAC